MRALLYHDATKHHFNRFSRSLGYLDWATQPNPFRRFADAPRYELPRRALADAVPYSALFSGRAPVLPLDEHSIGEFLRCSMGLSAWKQYGSSRWSLRVNPSSGNLHPTETYLITGAGVPGAEVRGGEGAEVLEDTEARKGQIQGTAVFHYDVARHALEQRCALHAVALPDDVFFVVLSSIHWGSSRSAL